MHRAAVWQHSSNSNITIVHNPIEHFLGNLSDFSSDAVLSCPRIVFTNLVFQIPPQRIVRWVEILGIGWPGLSVWCKMSLPHGKLYLRYSSVLFEKWGATPTLSQTEHLNTSGITFHETDLFRVKPTTLGHPIPKISTHLTIFWGGTWRTGFMTTIHRQEGTSSEKKSDKSHKKCSIELWTILMFELLLCCHTTAQCMERT